MKFNYFKQLGILAVMVILAGALLGCDENENKRGRFGFQGTPPRYVPNNTFNDQSRPNINSSIPGGGMMRDQGLGGGLGGLLGGMGNRNAQGDPRLDPSRQGGVMLPGSGGVNNGQRATKMWPYVIEQQDVKWAAECSGADKIDSDEDGICDDYEILNHASTATHPNTYNGFRVYGVKGSDLDSGEKLETLEIAASSITPITDNVGVITGGWGRGSEPTNWNTSIKDEYVGSRVQLPFIQEVAVEGTDSSNALLKKGNKFSVANFAGFASKSNPYSVSQTDSDYNVKVCAAGWFKKPVNSQGTAFRIMNAARWADDEVTIEDGGQLVAYSIRDNSEGSGFSKFFQERSKKFGGRQNQLDHKITDSSYHYMRFCYVNAEEKDGQGEIRYIRDVGKSDYGYEPLSAVDFRVVAPEFTDKDGEVKRLVEIDTKHALDGSAALVKDDDVIAQAEAMKQGKGEGSGKPCPGGNKPGCPETGSGTDLNAKIEEINNQIAEKEAEIALRQSEKAGLENQRSTLIGGELERIAAEIAALRAKEAYYNSLLHNTPVSENPPEGGELQTSIPALSMYFVFFNDKDNSAPDYGLNDANFEYIIEQMANAIAAAGSKKAKIEFRPLADGGSDKVNSQFQQNRVNVIKQSVVNKLKEEKGFETINSLDEAVMSIKVNEEGFQGAKGLFRNHRVMLIYVDNRE